MFCFIIPICIQNELHMTQLKRCIHSIRQFHEKNRIFLLNDSYDEYDKKVSECFHDDGRIIIYKSIVRGSADQQAFHFFLQNIEDDIAIILQDSMILNKPLDNIDGKTGIQFLWHFTNHVYDWDTIKEPVNEFNIQHNIKSHTDFIRYHLHKKYKQNGDFILFAEHALIHKNTWCGCFGNCCIIHKDALIEMNNKVHFSTCFLFDTSNRERRANETIFSLICHYTFPNVDFTQSYDGLYFDGIHVNPYSNMSSGFDNLVWCCKKNYVSKISFMR